MNQYTCYNNILYIYIFFIYSLFRDFLLIVYSHVPLQNVLHPLSRHPQMRHFQTTESRRGSVYIWSLHGTVNQTTTSSLSRHDSSSKKLFQTGNIHYSAKTNMDMVLVGLRFLYMQSPHSHVLHLKYTVQFILMRFFPSIIFQSQSSWTEQYQKGNRMAADGSSDVKWNVRISSLPP